MEAGRRSVVVLDETLKRFGGSAVLPGCVLRDHHLSSIAKVIYGIMLLYAWEDVSKRDGAERRDVVQSLVIELGISEAKARRALYQLQNSKLISTIRVGQNRPNLYFIESIAAAYPGFSEWSNLTTPKLELSDLPIPEWSGVTTSGVRDLSKMTTPNSEQTVQNVRELLDLTTPNVKRFNVERINVNVSAAAVERAEPQLDLGGQTVLERLIDEMQRASGPRYEHLMLTYRMIEELQDPRSLRFYWRVAQLMPAGVIEMTLSEVKDLEKTGRLRKTKAAAFTHIILIHARERGIKLRTKVQAS